MDRTEKCKEGLWKKTDAVFGKRLAENDCSVVSAVLCAGAADEAACDLAGIDP